MKKWFAVHTHIREEDKAEHHLREQGFETYCPRFETTRSHARKVETVHAPLFPRYIFVAFDPESVRWRAINSTRGVCWIVRLTDRPTPVPDRVVQLLKERETEAGLVPLEAINLFSQGEVVEIKSGAFQDTSAVFESLAPGDRANILLHFLGREMKVKIPLKDLKAA